MSVVRRAMLAKVHIAAKELALAEESYRAIFQRITGKTTAGECGDAQLDAVLAEFKRLGWKPKVRKPTSNVPHVRMIHGLWNAMKPKLADGSDGALRAFVRRQTRDEHHPDGIDRPEWLDAAQATKVIEGLKAWGARLKKGRADAGT